MTKSSKREMFILEYLVRITSDMENTVSAMKRNIDLNNIDSIDIIDYIESLAAYRTMIQIEKDIVNILSWNV